MNHFQTNKTLTLTSFVLLSILLSSCGWQLRGSQAAGSADSYPETISYYTNDQYSDLNRDFVYALKQKRIGIDNSNTDAGIATADTITVSALNEKVSSRTATLNALLDPAETEIIYQLNYKINQQAYQIELNGRYGRKKNRNAARDNERANLVRELRLRAIDQLFSQLLINTATASQ